MEWGIHQFNEFINAFGFVKCEADPCIYFVVLGYRPAQSLKGEEEMKEGTNE